MLMRNLLGVVGAVLLFANCTSQQKENVLPTLNFMKVRTLHPVERNSILRNGFAIRQKICRHGQTMVRY